MFWKNNKVKENIMIFLRQNESPNINYIENNAFFFTNCVFIKDIIFMKCYFMRVMT